MMRNVRIGYCPIGMTKILSKDLPKLEKSTYLTIEALEDGLTVSFTNPLEYSFDSKTWQSLPSNTQTPAINKDQYVAFRANLNPEPYNGIGIFAFNKKCNIGGNLMSLLFGDEFEDKTDLTGYDYAFYKIFNGCKNVVEAHNLILPATTLSESCYVKMFNGCTSLVNVPELPATKLTSSCYNNMFSGCTGLTIAPELPATTLANSCYSNMFSGCGKLTIAPELPATTLTLSCYSYMFYGCTSLVNAPELPATTLAYNCYQSMFSYCTSLVTSPALPATTLVDGCYYCMFEGCTSLVNAPELTAAILARSCYYKMFNGCTDLNYIKALFTTTPSESYTNNWVKNVSSTGTFVKSKDATWDVTGDSGVPENWTVEVA